MYQGDFSKPMYSNTQNINLSVSIRKDNCIVPAFTLPLQARSINISSLKSDLDGIRPIVPYGIYLTMAFV